jgi:hypothetical protein
VIPPQLQRVLPAPPIIIEIKKSTFEFVLYSSSRYFGNQSICSLSLSFEHLLTHSLFVVCHVCITFFFHHSWLENSTATADGHMMSQLLATFSPHEIGRFNAYQRSSFSASVMEPYIAACIQHRYYQNNTHTNNNNNSIHHHPHRTRGPPTVRTPNESGTVRPQQQPSSSSFQLPLEDLVAPGQAQEIGWIVATAAKIYAQRLVTEAVMLQRKQAVTSTGRVDTTQHGSANTDDDDAGGGGDDNDPRNRRSSSSNGNRTNHPRIHSSSNTDSILLCTSVYQAVQERQQRGADPGFFIPASISNTSGGGGGVMECTTQRTSFANLYELRRRTAIAAQEEYDQLKNLPAQQQETDEADSFDPMVTVE